ncbi:hypothetical protein [Duganella sp. Root1480D1]|uniref:hypothetical protein n=1 Tax=Duganella sp. Root1480D1 TaxID=1736471 RepID=UPI0012E3A222|nr:hypothetical protein [Duganella sp. Root1480D1]
MINENVAGRHGTDIVGAIFKRLGRNAPEAQAVPEHFILEGRIKHVETGRRTFALTSGGRVYCISWDDVTKFNGTAVSNMHGTEVVVNARANIMGLHAESITAAA